MKITKISPAVKTPGRYNIFVDGSYSFSLDEVQLVSQKIKKGDEVDEVELEELKSDSEFGKNYIRAIDLISRRFRSEKEIIDYGFRKKWTKINTTKIIDRLKQHGYLDDYRFAENYVRSRTNMSKYSNRRIRMDLQRKGIKSEIIDQLLSDSDNDQTTLDQLIVKRINRYDSDSKLIAYLARNGFRYDDINRALTRYKNKDNS